MMILMENSLAVVLLGDWSRFYIQPDWVAKNVFRKEEIEIGVNGIGTDVSISYRSESITIVPAQDKITFGAANIKDDTLQYLSWCLNNYVEQAPTPQPIAYGFNIDYQEEDGSRFSELLDSMSDVGMLIDCGCEIVTTKIERSLKYEGKILNMSCVMDGHLLGIHFNEHHDPKVEKPTFHEDTLSLFIQECSDIISGLGYEIERGES